MQMVKERFLPHVLYEKAYNMGLQHEPTALQNGPTTWAHNMGLQGFFRCSLRITPNSTFNMKLQTDRKQITFDSKLHHYM